MKAIASQFSISISQRNVPAEKLRILPRPIYRYADADSGVIDGAIIAFVQGTDSEAFLIIEARSSDDGGDWQYAIARCTTWAVTARLGANTVYEVEHYYASGPHGMSAPFLCYPRMPVD
jgi:hypothetical protein